MALHLRCMALRVRLHCAFEKEWVPIITVGGGKTRALTIVVSGKWEAFKLHGPFCYFPALSS